MQPDAGADSGVAMADAGRPDSPVDQCGPLGSPAPLTGSPRDYQTLRRAPIGMWSVCRAGAPRVVPQGEMGQLGA